MRPSWIKSKFSQKKLSSVESLGFASAATKKNRKLIR